MRNGMNSKTARELSAGWPVAGGAKFQITSLCQRCARGRNSFVAYCGRDKPGSEYIGPSSSSVSKPGEVAMLGKLPTTK